MTQPCCEKCFIPVGPFKGGCCGPDCPCHRPTSENYERDHSHVHCWEQKNPPGGQKIEHLKCCICEKKNPKATSERHQDNSGCPCYRVPWCHIEPCKGPPKVESHQECCATCGKPLYGTIETLRGVCDSHQAQGADWEKEFDQHFGVFGDGIASKDEVKSFIRKAIEQAREEGFQKGKEHYSSFAFEGGQQAAYQKVRKFISDRQTWHTVGMANQALADILSEIDKLINKTI